MTDQPIHWNSYEAKASSIANERRAEDVQLEQLRLQKMRDREVEVSQPPSAA